MILVADESVDRPIVERLRLGGHDTTYVAELSSSLGVIPLSVSAANTTGGTMAKKSTIKTATKPKPAKAKQAPARATSKPVAPEPAGGATKPRHPVFAMKFAKVYPMYVRKAEAKGRTKKEVDQIICWLTGYSQAGLQQQIEREVDFETFYAQAPAYHPNSSLITGVVCGIRVEDIKDPLMQRLRHLDKLIDELAKGKPMEKILRQ
jgi:hypothetical protein